MVEHYLKLGNELNMFFYKNHFTLTKDLHTFLHIFKINLSLIRNIIWEVIRMRPISIIYKHTCRVGLKKELQKEATFAFFT